MRNTIKFKRRYDLNKGVSNGGGISFRRGSLYAGKRNKYHGGRRAPIGTRSLNPLRRTRKEIRRLSYSPYRYQDLALEVGTASANVQALFKSRCDA